MKRMTGFLFALGLAATAIDLGALYELAEAVKSERK